MSTARLAKPYLVEVKPPTPAPTPAPLLRVFVAGSPPSSNHMYAARGTGAARHLTAEARAWREAVAMSVMPWRFAERAPRPTLAVTFFWMGTRSDIDNPIKLSLDGVKLGLAVDDRHVVDLDVHKRPLSPGTEKGAWIEVTELPPVAAQRAPRKARNKRTA